MLSFTPVFRQPTLVFHKLNIPPLNTKPIKIIFGNNHIMVLEIFLNLTFNLHQGHMIRDITTLVLKRFKMGICH